MTNQSPRQATLLARRQIIQFIKEVSGTKATQLTLARLSAIHFYLYENDAEYEGKVNEIRNELGRLEIASCIQDCYHHTHLINSFLLCLIKGRKFQDLFEAYPPQVTCLTLLKNICSIEENEFHRHTNQSLVYPYLRDRIQGFSFKKVIHTKKIDELFTMIQGELNVIKSEINEMKGFLNGINTLLNQTKGKGRVNA